jgi:hypothetical protein
MSSLGDMHDNGIHDYMKLVKFGHGRSSDHVSKDVRDVRMNHDQVRFTSSRYFRRIYDKRYNVIIREEY